MKPLGYIEKFCNATKEKCDCWYQCGNRTHCPLHRKELNGIGRRVFKKVGRSKEKRKWIKEFIEDL